MPRFRKTITLWKELCWFRYRLKWTPFNPFSLVYMSPRWAPFDVCRKSLFKIIRSQFSLNFWYDTIVHLFWHVLIEYVILLNKIVPDFQWPPTNLFILNSIIFINSTMELKTQWCQCTNELLTKIRTIIWKLHIIVCNLIIEYFFLIIGVFNLHIIIYIYTCFQTKYSKIFKVH